MYNRSVKETRMTESLKYEIISLAFFYDIHAMWIHTFHIRLNFLYFVKDHFISFCKYCIYHRFLRFENKSNLKTRQQKHCPRLSRISSSGLCTSIPRGGGGGGTRGVRHTGVCRSNRSLFWEKSLNIGYGFELEILKHAPYFCNFAVDTIYFRPFRR